MTYLLALDQGTSSSRSIVFDREGRIVAIAQQELTQIYPQPGWVEHDPMEIWTSQLATAREVLAKAKLDSRATSPPSASPTSARPPCCGTARPASRCTTPSSGRTGAPSRCAPGCASDGMSRHHPRQDRPGDRRLLLRHQAALAARQRARRARRGRARRAGLRHRRQLADLAADRRQGARHRREQRLAHHAVQRAQQRSGTPSC